MAADGLSAVSTVIKGHFITVGKNSNFLLIYATNPNPSTLDRCTTTLSFDCDYLLP